MRSDEVQDLTIFGMSLCSSSLSMEYEASASSDTWQLWTSRGRGYKRTTCSSVSAVSQSVERHKVQVRRLSLSAFVRAPVMVVTNGFSAVHGKVFHNGCGSLGETNKSDSNLD